MKVFPYSAWPKSTNQESVIEQLQKDVNDLKRATALVSMVQKGIA